MLQGTVTAMITPFTNGEVDEEGLKANIRFQMESGVSGLLVLGTTGEASTLSTDEQRLVVSLAAKTIECKIPLWVGTGSNCTRQTIEKTRLAKALGADIALIVTPYYNRPTQEGIFRHFEAVSYAVDIPIVIYNIPGRCSTNIETPTLLRIASLPNVIGVKEASGSVVQAMDVLASTKRFPDFAVFCGDDALTLPMLSLGAKGVISVVSNLIPAQVCAMVNAALASDFSSARKLHFDMLPLFKAAFMETNPVPIKTAMNACGMAAGKCRLPLYEMSAQNEESLLGVVKAMGLVNLAAV